MIILKTMKPENELKSCPFVRYFSADLFEDPIIYKERKDLIRISRRNNNDVDLLQK